MTRSRLRVTVVGAGLILLVGHWLAPRVPPTAILTLSIPWLAAAAYLLYAAYLILMTVVGRAVAAVAVLVLASAPVLLTAVRFSPSMAVQLPCPRNWAWLPTWQLRPSPMASVSFTVGQARVKLCYGRPASRGRKMLGGKLVPFGQLWRTGANEPTTIISTGPLEVAGMHVPAGRSSLYTVPGPETWEIILNRSTSQWGIESEYTDAIKAQELGRAILPSENAPVSTERLVFLIEPGARGRNDGADLVLRWEHTQIRIPLAPASR